MMTNQKQIRSILLALYVVSAASYLIAPILPIYFIESVAKGGLAWPKSVAMPLVGTYIAMTYIAPCIGGILADTFCGRTWTMVLGYCFTFASIIVLRTMPLPDLIPYELSILALGIGIIKVCLTASIGSFCPTPEESRTAYGHQYVVACLGFMTGGVLSNPLFDRYGMNMLLTAALCGIALSTLLSIPASLSHARFTQNIPADAGGTQKGLTGSLWLFITLLIISTLFFICSNQINTSIVVFLHTAVDRSVGNLTIPTLWFGAFASLAVTLLSPLIRRIWATFESRHAHLDPIKIGVGGLFVASSLAILGLLSIGHTTHASISGGLPLLALVHIGIMIADAHVRPTLFSAATRMTPQRFHTVATALVYTGIGCGGKLAGVLAGTIDASGFSTVFATAAWIASGVCVLCLGLWARIRTSPANASLGTIKK